MPHATSLRAASGRRRTLQISLPRRSRTAPCSFLRIIGLSRRIFVAEMLSRRARTTNIEAELDFNQLRAFTAFRRGYPVAMLGGAGSGKSFLLSRIIQDGRARYGTCCVMSCAWTNQAAGSIGGRTIHSWFGLRPGFNFDKEDLWQHVQKNEALCDFFQDVKVVFIDEVSVLKDKVLDAIDWVMRHTARTVRHACMPMGGRQLILAGDPFQLEPIGVNYAIDGEKHAFAARTWLLTFGGFGSGVIALLKGNHRQEKDEIFYKILHRIRQGLCSDDDIRLINSTSDRCRTMPRTHTVLCLLRNKVEARNKLELSKIVGPELYSHAHDTFFPSRMQDTGKRLHELAPQIISVKAGCDVIVTRKIGELGPGARVTVVSASLSTEDVSKLPLLYLDVRQANDDAKISRVMPVKFEVYGTSGSVLACRKQLPVVSAYALTVHRSQGLTLRRVAMDFGQVGSWIPNGMAYVALIRCTSLDGLWIRGFEKKHVTVNKHAIQVMQDIKKLKDYYGHRVISSCVTGMPQSYVESKELQKIRKRKCEPESDTTMGSKKNLKVLHPQARVRRS